MSVTPTRVPPREGLDRYRAGVLRARGEEDLRVRRALGGWLGAIVGVALGCLLIPLALVVSINALEAMAAALALGFAGWGYGRFLGGRSEDWARLRERRESELGFEDHARELAAIQSEAAALREAGVDPQTIATRALQMVEVANRRLQGRLAVDGRTSGSSPPLGTPVGPPPSSAPAGLVAGPSPELPVQLAEAKRNGVLVPFVGAGLSLGPDVKGGFPTWMQLPERLLNECGAHRWDDARDAQLHRDMFLEPDPEDPTRVRPRVMTLDSMLIQLDAVKRKLGDEYGKALSAIFRPRDAAPGAAHRALVALDTRVILTSNFDQLIEAAEGPPSRSVYTWRRADAALADLKAGHKLLFKVHGSAEDETSVVLTMSEYAESHRDPAYRMVLNHLLTASSFLFVGYGMSDPEDLDKILRENAEILRRSGSLHFAALKRTGDPRKDLELRRRLLDEYHVAVIELGDFSEVVPLLEGLARR